MENHGALPKREMTRLRVQRHRELKRKRIEEAPDEDCVEVSPSSISGDNENDQERLQPDEQEYEQCNGNELSDDGQDELHNEQEFNSDGDTDELNSDALQREDEDSEYSTDDADELDEVQELRLWAQESNICHAHLDGILKILRRRLLPELSKTAKTFLKSAYPEYHIRKFDGNNGRDDGGEFVYFGIARYLEKTINIRLCEEPLLELLINIDGLPLYKSSSRQFWPILCKVYSKPDIHVPFPVAIFSGVEKPSNLEQFLADFITECNQLTQNGIRIENIQFIIRIKSFIFDRPARSFIKNIIGHGGYNACESCTVRGVRVENRTVYPEVHAELMSDRSFRNREHPGHHKGLSPLLSLVPEIDMVKQFSLDFMHLCCLGVMKKMLVDFWLGNKTATKISQNSKLRLTNYLLQLSSQIPNEFQRATRSLDVIAKWKATEFRFFFLLYAGPVLLKKVLSKDLYRHFLLLHVACRILCNEQLALTNNAQAKKYLQTFFNLAAHLYGRQSQIMNMHSLIHLADDAKNMNCSVTHLTAFPFENALGKLKRLIRSGNRPLAQVCRRLHESFFANLQKVKLPPDIVPLNEGRHELDGSIRIKKVQYKGFLITPKTPNNTVLLQNGKIVQIHAIYRRPDDDTIWVEGKLLRMKKPIFIYPCDSSHFKMWQVKKTQVPEIHRLKSIASKMVTLVLNDVIIETMYAISLIHF